VALRAMWVALSTIGLLASLCACTPSNRPTAENRVTPITAPTLAGTPEATRHYGSSTEPRIRHRTVAKHPRHRQEVQQADAEWVNPPLGAGE
jgi:hypothetical protein